jgi:head-tail adaptor
LKDAEMDQAGRIIVQAPWLITMPYGTVVTAQNRIGDQYGREFEVFAVLARKSEELHTGVLARLINEGAG